MGGGLDVCKCAGGQMSPRVHGEYWDAMDRRAPRSITRLCPMKSLTRFAQIILITASCMGHAGLAQTSGSPSVARPTQSWTSTSELQANNVNPIRVTDSHTQSGNRTVDVRSIQTRGADGRMEPYQDIERET